MNVSESNDQKIEKLEQKLRAQAELYGMLLDLARRQTQEISAENVDAFVLLLEEKKKVIEEIGKIELAAEPLRQFWEAHKDSVSEETRLKLRTAVDDLRTLLEELLELESMSQRKLGITKDTVEEQIRQVSVGPEAMRSYRHDSEGKPRFMDETG